MSHILDTGLCKATWLPIWRSGRLGVWQLQNDSMLFCVERAMLSASIVSFYLSGAKDLR